MAPPNPIKILGATLDSSLTMGPHTKATSKSCFHHIAPLGIHLWITLWPSLLLLLWSLRALIMLIPSCLIVHAACLQRVQQALARVITQQSSVSALTSTELFNNFIFFPSNGEFELTSLVYKVLNTGHLPYLTELLQYHKPARSTRSSACHLLSIPRLFCDTS